MKYTHHQGVHMNINKYVFAIIVILTVLYAWTLYKVNNQPPVTLQSSDFTRSLSAESLCQEERRGSLVLANGSFCIGE